MAHVHRYATSLLWSGSTAAGYGGYSRAHRVTSPPATTSLEVSADPSFRGDPDLLNPEQLLLAAASSCQLLSFLALAARAGIDVVDYTDEAEAQMPVTREPLRITHVLLRPQVTVAGEVDEARLTQLVHEAHATCYVANTLNAQVWLEPTFRGV